MKRRTFLMGGAAAAHGDHTRRPGYRQRPCKWDIASSFPAAAPGVGTNVTAMRSWSS